MSYSVTFITVDIDTALDKTDAIRRAAQHIADDPYFFVELVEQDDPAALPEPLEGRP